MHFLVGVRAWISDLTSGRRRARPLAGSCHRQGGGEGRYTELTFTTNDADMTSTINSAFVNFRQGQTRRNLSTREN